MTMTTKTAVLFGLVLLSGLGYVMSVPPIVTTNLTWPYITIPEDTPTNTTLFVITVTDSDHDLVDIQTADSDTANLIWLGVGPQGSTPINPVESHRVPLTVYVRVLKPLDRDWAVSSYSLQFVVTDSSNKTVSLDIVLFLTDVNDNAPSFENLPYRWYIYENATVGQQFSLITAIDIDNGCNGVVGYSMKPDVQSSSLAEEYNKTFVIDPVSRVVTMNKSIDYETINLYLFIIVAEDKGFPPLSSSAALVIHVVDVPETTTVSPVLPEIHNQTVTISVQDTSRGLPASNMHVVLSSLSSYQQFAVLDIGVTDKDGRGSFTNNGQWTNGTYKLRFETDQYFRDQNVDGFYPFIEVVFTIKDPSKHYHVPLLLSPYGYSTYKGN